MWTGGFPEPLTFSIRALRQLRARAGDFDVVHDNQALGYGMLGVPRLGLPLVTSIHHPITVDRRLDLAGRRLAAAAGQGAAGTASCACRAGWPGGGPADHRLRVLAGRISAGTFGVRARTACTSCRSAWTPGCSGRAREPRVPRPDRDDLTSADVPLKGLVSLLQALAKLAHRARRAPGRRRQPPRAADAASAVGAARPRRRGHASSRASADEELVDAARQRGDRLRPVPVRGVLAARRGAHGHRARRWSPPRAARCPRWPATRARARAAGRRGGTRRRAAARLLDSPRRDPRTGARADRACRRGAASGSRWPAVARADRRSLPRGHRRHRAGGAAMTPNGARSSRADRRLHPVSRIAPGDRVLDLGCGAGRHAFEVLPARRARGRADLDGGELSRGRRDVRAPCGSRRGRPAAPRRPRWRADALQPAVPRRALRPGHRRRDHGARPATTRA